MTTINFLNRDGFRIGRIEGEGTLHKFLSAIDSMLDILGYKDHEINFVDDGIFEVVPAGPCTAA